MKTNTIITLLISSFFLVLLFWMFSILDVKIFPCRSIFDSGSLSGSFVSLKAVLFDANVQVSSEVLLCGAAILAAISLLLGSFFTKVYFSQFLSE